MSQNDPTQNYPQGSGPSAWGSPAENSRRLLDISVGEFLSLLGALSGATQRPVWPGGPTPPWPGVNPPGPKPPGPWPGPPPEPPWGGFNVSRPGYVPGGESSQGSGAESAGLEAALESNNEAVRQGRDKLLGVMEYVGSSPSVVQVRFLKGLAEQPAEAQRFLNDPQGYAIEHGVMFDPVLVKDVVDAAVFDATIGPELANRLGAEGVEAVLNLRGPGTVAAWPAAVAAIAAVVAAAAAVVSAVTSVVKHNSADILAMKGLGARGVTLPSGERLGPAGPMGLMGRGMSGPMGGF